MTHQKHCISCKTSLLFQRRLGRNAIRVDLQGADYNKKLIEARAANNRIVLPEGAEPRTIRAAAICARRGIARCVLIGDRNEIQTVAQSQDVDLPENLEILNPAEIRTKYVRPLFEMRKHKGLSTDMAASKLEDNVVLGTMMIALGEGDGLVSGAVHSTANTIRPALQIIKTKPTAKVVSSIFFMCLPEQAWSTEIALLFLIPTSRLSQISRSRAPNRLRFSASRRVLR